jgi:predicted O-methyltransferase YrrM
MTTVNLTDLCLMAGAQQKSTELGALVDFLRPQAKRVILEIGTNVGGTLVLWMLMATPDALIISVDLPIGAIDGRDYLDAVKRNLRFRQPGQQVQLVRGDSHAASTKAEVEKLLAGREIDLLFIDGDHSYAGSKMDYDLFQPLVRDGGWIVWHDVNDHVIAKDCQVRPAWIECREGSGFTEFIDQQHDIGIGPWGGIGVMRNDKAQVAARNTTRMATAASPPIALAIPPLVGISRAGNV